MQKIKKPRNTCQNKAKNGDQSNAKINNEESEIKPLCRSFPSMFCLKFQERVQQAIMC